MIDLIVCLGVEMGCLIDRQIGTEVYVVAIGAQTGRVKGLDNYGFAGNRFEDGTIGE